MTSKTRLVAILLVVLVTEAWTQIPKGTMPRDVNDADNSDQWSFTATAYGYLVPHDQSYFSPILAADRRRLHLEARYNYEDQQTGSLWAGYTFSVGKKFMFEATPMIGVVFGSTNGVAPGYELSLTFKKVELSTQGEYVVDFDNHTGNFFYSWNELVYSPTGWFHVGVVTQDTRAYNTPLDIQRGVSVGVSKGKLDFTTYIFNFGWTDPTIVMGPSFKF
jgi:hypothetical protein